MTEEALNDNSTPTDDTDIHFKTLLVGFAPKLSTKNTGRIGFELALNTDDKCRYVRLTENDSGGLFSKEWISLDSLFELLESQQEDKPFKSSILKPLFKGGSANNISFLAAVCRCEDFALVLPTEKNQFLHVLNPLLANQKDRLYKLKPMRTSAKKSSTTTNAKADK